MQVLHYNPVNKGIVKGSFNILLPSGLIIYKMMYMEDKGREFVTPPSEKYTNSMGQTKYFNIVGARTLEIKDQFFGEALRCVKKFLKENPEAAYKPSGERSKKDHVDEPKADEGVPF